MSSHRTNLVRASILLSTALTFSAAGVGAQSFSYVPVISAYAGATTACSTATDTIGDGCPATSSVMKNPFGSVTDRQGNIYFADSGNSVIRRIDVLSGIITTVVGIAPGSGNVVCAGATDTVGDGCPATQAKLSGPYGVTFDPIGNLVIPDPGDQRVRIVDKQTGIVTTLLGNGVGGAVLPDNSHPQPANQTEIGNPSFATFDSSGNLYVTAQTSQSVTMVVATNGVILPGTSLAYNLAGNGKAGNGGEGGVATDGQFNTPRGVAVDSAGNILVDNYTTCNVRKITSPFQNGTLNLAGTVLTTIAGTGTCATTIVNGGQASATPLGHFESETLDNTTGTIYLPSYGSPGDAVRTVNLAANTVGTYTGTGTRSNTGDNGPAVAATIDGATGISFSGQGDAFVSGYSNGTIRRISLGNSFFHQAVGGTTTAQTVIGQANQGLTLTSATVASSLPSAAEFAVGTLSGCSAGGALAQNAYCKVPVTFTPSLPGLRTAHLVLTDSNSVTSTLGLSGLGIAPSAAFSTGAISTVAGTGTAGNANVSGPATAAQVSSPRGGAVDATGNIYFADTGNNIVRKITSAGTISTVAGSGVSGSSGDGGLATSAQLSAPTKVAVDAAGNLYIADTGNSTVRFVSVDTGKISTIAGTGTAAYSGDGGLATAATLNHPQGLAVDRAGNVYVADTGNNVIRFFPIGGYISTFAGTGQAGFAGDGGAAALAQFNAPTAITIDSNSNIYVADTNNGVVRMIPITNQVSTVAGSASGTTNSGDGGAATSATLQNPSDIAVDAAGVLYIASGGVVRLVNSSGIISTIAGSGTGKTYSGDGGTAVSASLASSRLNLMLDGAFNLYIADTDANRILLAADSQSSTLTFSKQTPGSTGSATQVSVLNTGNAALSISNITVSSNFELQSSGATACTTTTTLNPGQSCTLSVAFSPDASASGVLNGSVVITDNALNNTASAQTISVTGDAVALATTKTTVAIAPSSLVYGATGTVTATATVSGGASPTGSVSFTLNGTSLGSIALASGQATVTLPALPAGSGTVTAAYQGDANNSSSSGSAPFTVQPAVLTVTATSVNVNYGDPLPTLTYKITGYVNGETSSVVSGTPAETTTAPSSTTPGTYPVTVARGTLSAANYTFTFVNGTLTVGAPPPPDYTITLTPSSTSVAAGVTGVVTIGLTPLHGYSGTVTLACGALPTDVACSFTGPLKGDGKGDLAWVQVNLSTTGNKVASAITPATGNTRGIMLALGAPLCFFGLTFCSRKRRKLGQLLAIVVLTIIAVGATSCSTGTNGSPAPTGTYQIVITGTDAAASLSHSATLTLTIH